MKTKEELLKELPVLLKLDKVERYVINDYCGDCITEINLKGRKRRGVWSGVVAIARSGKTEIVVFPCKKHLKDYLDSNQLQWNGWEIYE